MKSASGLDAFLFNITGMSIGMGLLAVYLVVPGFNPGASIPLTWLIATVMLIPIALAYYWWSVTLPRTGGNYVYLSRSMPLSLALVFNYIELYALLFFAAFAASFVAPVISGTVWFLGAHSGSQGMIDFANSLQSKWWTFGLGVGATLIAIAVQLRGTTVFFRIQRLLFPIAMVTVVVMLISLLFASGNSFSANLASLTGVTGASVLHTAQKAGYVHHGFDLWSTIKALSWPINTMWAFYFSISFGGEIKEARKGQFAGIVGSVIAFGVFALIASVIINGAIDVTLQGALLWNGSLPNSSALATIPTLAMITVNSPAIAVLISISFLLWVFFWLTNVPGYCNRAFFAHAIDRLAPAAVGYVSPRKRVPLGSMLAGYTLMLIFFALYVFSGFFSALAIGMPLYFGFIASLASGAVLSRSRPTLWRRSPAAAYRVGRVPAMAIACALGVAVLIAVELLVYSDPSSFAHTRSSWIAVGVIVALAVLAYLGISRLRRREGVDVVQITREIPVE